MLNSEVNSSRPTAIGGFSKNETEMEFMLTDVIKHGAFTVRDTLLCTQIMVGCCDLVNSLEQQWYGKNSKSTKLSEKNLTDLVIFSVEGKNFSPNNIKTALSNRGLSAHKKSLFRSINDFLNVNYLEKSHYAEQKKKGPGRPPTAAQYFDGSEIIDQSHPRRIYKESDLVLFFKRYVNDYAPRYLIAIWLLDCGLTERYLILREYILSMILKNEGVEERISLDRGLGIINDESKDSYSQEYQRLTEMTKKEILSDAKAKAKRTLIEIDWLHPLYTMFFVGGAMRYAVVMTHPSL